MAPKRHRKPMPKIDSINQLREFIKYYDAINSKNKNVSEYDKKRYDNLAYRLRGRLNVKNPKDFHPEDFIEDLRRIVNEFDRVMAECLTKRVPTIRLGCTPLLSVRLIPSLLKIYNQEMGDNASIPKVELVYDISYRKESERMIHVATDLSLTYREAGATHFEDRELENESFHRRCIITRNDNPFCVLKEPIERGEFDWGFLRGRRIAIVNEDSSLPNFPYKLIASVAQLVIVREVLEAHEYVRAGNADLAFTHIDALTTGEVRDLTVIRLSGVAAFSFGKSRICLLRSCGPVLAEKQLGIKVLTEVISSYLANVKERHEKSAWCTENLNRYQYAYFPSYVRAELNGAVERRWFRGRIQFEVFVSHVISDGFHIWFVKAIHDIDAPVEIKRSLYMFGRVHSRPDDCVMSWFGTYSREGQASLRLMFSLHHLETDDYDFIEGIWAGRPSWLPEGDQLYTVSAFILHKSPDLSDEVLNDLMTQIYKRAKIQLSGDVDLMIP